MKALGKIIITGFMAVFSVAAFAEFTQISGGDVIGQDGSSDGVDHECVLLGDRVKVSLSTSIVAGFECEELTSAIDIATCHPAGQREARDITCTKIAEDENGAAIYNHPDCTGTANQDDGTTEIVSNAISYIAYVASSTGGNVAPTPLDADCDATRLGILPLFN